MTGDQVLVSTILLVTIVLFIIERWRYDVVAVICLMALAITGLVPAERLFLGFGNPAVITVAAVLVLRKALQNSGIVDFLSQRLLMLKGGLVTQLLVLTTLVGFLSSFINNIGALALVLPIAIRVAQKKHLPISAVLMPVAFVANLGGNITLIGTPSNLLVSSFRESALGLPYRVFDFALVGIGVTLAGILVSSLLGWRLIPCREGQLTDDLFNIEHYVTEVRVNANSKILGLRIKDLHDLVDFDLNIISIISDGMRRLSPGINTVFKAGDILIIAIDTGNLDRLVTTLAVDLVGDVEIERADLESSEVALIEAVVVANSLMVGATANSLRLRNQYGVNLLAISRQGSPLRTRMDRIRFREGDVLLLQTHVAAQREALATLGCLPLAERALQIGKPRQMLIPLAVFLGGIILTILGWMSVAAAFTLAALVMVLIRTISLREVYTSIDWPVIILLGSMLPLGEALETTGTAALIANGLLSVAGDFSLPVILAVFIFLAMLLSNVVNNVATVVLMAPVGIGLAHGLGVSIDPFLIAIIIGSSSAFLTPLDSTNTLVMGPGGYHFGDYWRLGLVLEIVVILVSVPLIALLFPF